MDRIYKAAALMNVAERPGGRPLRKLRAAAAA